MSLAIGVSITPSTLPVETPLRPSTTTPHPSSRTFARNAASAAVLPRMTTCGALFASV